MYQLPYLDHYATPTTIHCKLPADQQVPFQHDDAPEASPLFQVVLRVVLDDDKTTEDVQRDFGRLAAMEPDVLGSADGQLIASYRLGALTRAQAMQTALELSSDPDFIDLASAEPCDRSDLPLVWENPQDGQPFDAADCQSAPEFNDRMRRIRHLQAIPA